MIIGNFFKRTKELSRNIVPGRDNLAASRRLFINGRRYIAISGLKYQSAIQRPVHEWLEQRVRTNQMALEYSLSGAAYADKRRKYWIAQRTVYGMNGGKFYPLGHNDGLLQVLAGKRFWRVASRGHCDLTDAASGRGLGLFDGDGIGQFDSDLIR